MRLINVDKLTEEIKKYKTMSYFGKSDALSIIDKMHIYNLERELVEYNDTSKTLPEDEEIDQ